MARPVASVVSPAGLRGFRISRAFFAVRDAGSRGKSPVFRATRFVMRL